MAYNAVLHNLLQSNQQNKVIHICTAGQNTNRDIMRLSVKDLILIKN